MDANYRKAITLSQHQLLLDFAESNRDFALGRFRSKEARVLSARLWRECAQILNAEGPARKPKEWAKVWNDLKSRVRAKLAAAKVSQCTTGGGPPSNICFTSIEERVANFIGRNVGPIVKESQDQFSDASIMDANCRRATTLSQQQLLLDFAESNRDLALGRLRSKEARVLSARLWRECAQILNAEGPARKPKEWAKMWNDLKSRVRTKLAAANVSQCTTGGGPPSNICFTSIEERVANIIGRNVGPIVKESQDQFSDASSRGALEPSRSEILRIEELRARTDCLLAEASLRQAETARAQSKAIKIFLESFSTVPQE
ncbi:uncharacterized protein LOC113228197 isoform X2 [Hyposmocoma kahamanoa]|uniref:uncharacterized protein LOC113228197 isoform X2 n=1 Tax=Hyposmocoma kahamanoa TaxID=1477025 RepID=UPI000E6D76CD|nr:uncharacterized protein LOC113228197 isoform X2 [Hyposmocoma kahamanoa]